MKNRRMRQLFDAMVLINIIRHDNSLTKKEKSELSKVLETLDEIYRSHDSD